MSSVQTGDFETTPGCLLFEISNLNDWLLIGLILSGKEPVLEIIPRE